MYTAELKRERHTMAARVSEWARENRPMDVRAVVELLDMHFAAERMLYDTRAFNPNVPFMVSC